MDCLTRLKKKPMHTKGADERADEIINCHGKMDGRVASLLTLLLNSSVSRFFCVLSTFLPIIFYRLSKSYKSASWPLRLLYNYSCGFIS